MYFPLIILYLLFWLFSINSLKNDFISSDKKFEEIYFGQALYIRLDSTGIFTETTISNLNVPWEIAWGPDNWIWFTEQDGLVSKVNPETGEKKLLLKIPNVYRKRLGLLSMVIHPDLENFPYVFFNHLYLKENEEIVSKLVRYDFHNDTLTNPVELFEIPGNTGHNGARIVIAPDGKIMWATGDADLRNDETNSGNAQHLNSMNGKILRLNIDGTIPEDNPYPGSAVWARGFRVPQGMVYNTNGLLYTAEHGDVIDDEVNIITKGGNYGYPNVVGICDHPKELEYCATHNIIPPLFAWTPTIAPAGIAFYNSTAIPEWQNSIIMVTLKTQSFRVLKLDSTGTSVVSEEVYFNNSFGRLRDICVSPAGDVYISTSNRDWNPGEGFPKETDDRIIKISKKMNVENELDNQDISGLNSSETMAKVNENPKFSAGQKIYQNYCSSCHKIDGSGLNGIFPPLKGSPKVSGDKDLLINLVLKGISGSSHLKNSEYEQEMPAFNFLSDQQITEVLNLIRKDFGNNSGLVSPQEVAKVREVKQ
ncbi:hypothetical protein BH23BAC1_BH23BAC1_32010 [soil metagenome]